MLETPPDPCIATLGQQPPAEYAGDAIELDVGAFFWDLVDEPGDVGALTEPHDTLANLDVQIFQVMDHELDIYGLWPTVGMFRAALIGRGVDAGAIDQIFAQYHIPIPPPISEPGPGSDPGTSVPDPCQVKPSLCQTPTPF
jgi:hypothetical protein